MIDRDDPIERAEIAATLRIVRRVKDADGFPMFVPIRENGERIWMRESDFGIEGYLQVVAYFRKRGTLKKAEAYRARAKARFGIEIPDSPASN